MMLLNISGQSFRPGVAISDFRSVHSRDLDKFVIEFLTAVPEKYATFMLITLSLDVGFCKM